MCPCAPARLEARRVAPAGARKTPSTMPSPLGPPNWASGDPRGGLEQPEAARLRFRGFCYHEAGGPREALARLRALCRQWLRPEARSKEQMLELLVLEQFLGALPPEIQAWVQAQRPGSPEEAAALVEGLQQDPARLLRWVSQVLRRERPPAAQEAVEPLGDGPPAGAAGLPQTAPEEAPQDSEGGAAAQLSCSVKEEPDAPGTAPSSPPAPAQDPEGPLGHQEPARSTVPAPEAQEEWGLLDSSQKELYWDAMLEKYGSVVSLGLPAPGADAPEEPGPEPGTPRVGREAQSPLGAGELCEGPAGAAHGGAGPPAPGGPGAGRADARVPPPPPPPGAEDHGDGDPGPEPQPGVAGPGPRGASAGQGPPAGAGPAPSPGGARSPPYTCAQCGRGFDWKSVFVIHHRSHAGPGAGGPEKPPPPPRPREPCAPRAPRRAPPGPRGYACDECGRGFSWKSQLVIHRKGHAGQRRHFCGDCGRGFDWKSQLVIHRKGHRPEAP